MTQMQYAWLIYAAGSLGCCIATWWMFLWAWRFIRYSMVVTVMVILVTPYAIDAQTMLMAPAIYTMVFDGLSSGMEAIKPVIKLMVGIWLIAITLVLVFVILTRGSAKPTYKPYTPNGQTHRQDVFARLGSHKDNPRASQKHSRQHHAVRTKRLSPRDLNGEEHLARDELLKGEIPMRAVRD